MTKLRKKYMVAEGKTPHIRTKHIQKGGISAWQKKLAKKLGRHIGKAPGVIGAIGSGIAAVAAGNPNEALASALGSDNIGSGSDAVGDMKLSRAELLNAERKQIRAAKEREFLKKKLGK